MAKITLRFANKGKQFCLCALVSGQKIRHYKVVQGLINPNFQYWSPKMQMFVSNKREDMENNAKLLEFIEPYEKLLEEYEFESGKELFAAIETPNYNGPKKRTQQKPKLVKKPKPKPEMTLGEWMEALIEDMKNPTNRKPSSNFQTYNTLLHKLEMEGSVINTPIAKVNRQSLEAFSEWVLEQRKLKGSGNNYIAIMKKLQAAINKARKAGVTTYVPDFPYMDHAPIINKTSEKAADVNQGGTIKSLSPEQYIRFLAIDPDSITLRHPLQHFYKQLYKDFCILLYEMKSRPMDIMKLHWDNIAYNETYGRWVCSYIPGKKKNYALTRENDSNPLAVQFLTPGAMDIILKYKGRSRAGYVLPFSFHDRKWNLNDAKQYHTYYTKQNRMQGKINRFLKKIGKLLDLPFPLTLYAFRRTAITKAIIDNKMPISMIAKVAGTSVGMIEHHYVNYLDALAAY